MAKAIKIQVARNGARALALVGGLEGEVLQGLVFKPTLVHMGQRPLRMYIIVDTEVIMDKLSLNDGWRELMINEDPSRIIKWNPTDTNFSKRYLDFMEYAESLGTRLQEIANDSHDTESGDKLSEKGAKQLRELYSIGEEFSKELDRAFNSPVSQAVFLGSNPISPTNNGKFIFENFLDAIAPIIVDSLQASNESLDRRVKSTMDAIKKSTRKAAKGKNN